MALQFQGTILLRTPIASSSIFFGGIQFPLDVMRKLGVEHTRKLRWRVGRRCGRMRVRIGSHGGTFSSRNIPARYPCGEGRRHDGSDGRLVNALVALTLVEIVIFGIWVSMKQSLHGDEEGEER
jgi:hypothetical protein